MNAANVKAQLDERAVRANLEHLGVQKFESYGPDNWLVRAPYREDRDPSCSVHRGTGAFNDKATGDKGDIFDLVMMTTGSSLSNAVELVANVAGISPNGQRMISNPEAQQAWDAVRPDARPSRAPVVATYHYVNEQGEPLYTVSRNANKNFFVKQAAGTTGYGNRRVLYGLDEVVQSAVKDRWVLLCEGEKDAERLRNESFIATTSPGGSNGWKEKFGYVESLRDRKVAIIPDLDDPGYKYAQAVARSLAGVASEIRLIELPGLGERLPKGGKDVSDWLDEGHDANELKTLVLNTPAWESDGDESAEEQPSRKDHHGDGDDEPVNLDDLLDAVIGFTRRYVVYTAHQQTATALWVAHTHAFDAAEATPYLEASSAEMRSGKSRYLECLGLLVARPWLTGRTTAAALYRKIDKDQPTLLLDESDAAFGGDKEYSETLRGVLNTGHRRGGTVSVCVGQGANIDVKDFSTFSPKVIAGIGDLPDTVSDRSIHIKFKRKKPDEQVERFRYRDARKQAEPIRSSLARWATTAISTLRDARPDLPPELDDRAADGWEPLLAIADLAGGNWPKRARDAAEALSGGDARDDDSLGVRLLGDIRRAFDDSGDDRILTTSLLARLNDDDEAPWGGFRDGDGMNGRNLARILSRYEIAPTTVRSKEARGKGYKREGFADAWDRYLPGTPSEIGDIGDMPGNIEKIEDDTSVTQSPMSRIENADFPDSGANVTDVTDSEGGNGRMGPSTPAEDDDWDRWFAAADIKAAEELGSEAANDEEWIDVDARHRSVPTSN